MKDKHYDSIIQIGNCLVSGDIVTEYFSCDYAKCKGCCCVIGDCGAPLREEELDKIENVYPVFNDLMSAKGRETVDNKGFFEIDIEGDIVTPLCEGTQECAYTCFAEDGSCFCSMEKRFFEGKSAFRKPISCWLYPIRITKLSNGMDALNLHRWNICADAFAKGKKEGVRVYEFLREPLISLYGEDFYSALSAAAMRLNASS